MWISYVLRLRTEELAGGHFVGEIEDVGSAERHQVRTIDEMAAFILRTAAQADAPDGERRGGDASGGSGDEV